MADRYGGGSRGTGGWGGQAPKKKKRSKAKSQNVQAVEEAQKAQKAKVKKYKDKADLFGGTAWGEGEGNRSSKRAHEKRQRDQEAEDIYGAAPGKVMRESPRPEPKGPGKAALRAALQKKVAAAVLRAQERYGIDPKKKGTKGRGKLKKRPYTNKKGKVIKGTPDAQKGKTMGYFERIRKEGVDAFNPFN